MKYISVFALCLCFPSIAMAEEWKGITPGLVTRADVVRLFQKCNDRLLPCEFDVDGDAVRIVFSGMVQDHFYQCAGKLPADTVLLIEVTPRLPISLKRYRQSHSLKKLYFAGYVDERAGLILKTRGNKIIQLNYVAAGSDRLRCEDYYRDPIKFVQINTHYPPVNLEGPTGTVTTGDILELKADLQPDPKITLVWIVSGGKILNQSGNRITLDTSGLDGQTLKVTVQAHGSHTVESSATFQIRPATTVGAALCGRPLLDHALIPKEGGHRGPPLQLLT